MLGCPLHNRHNYHRRGQLLAVPRWLALLKLDELCPWAIGLGTGLISFAHVLRGLVRPYSPRTTPLPMHVAKVEAEAWQDFCRQP